MHYPAVAAVGDPERAGGVDREVRRRVQLPEARPGPEPEPSEQLAARVVVLDAVPGGRHVNRGAVWRGCDTPRRIARGEAAAVAARGRKPRHARVAGVGNPQGAVSGARDRARVEQLARTGADRAEARGVQRCGAAEREDPAAPLIEHEAVACLVERDVDRPAQDRGARVRRSPDRRNRSVGVQQLDAPVDRICDSSDARGVNGDASRSVELAGRAAGGAERAQQGAAAREHVDPVVAGVGDVQLALCVGGECTRVGELSGTGPVRAPAGAVLEVRRSPEAHDPLIHVIRHERGARAVDRHTEGEAQLSGACALAGADRANELAAEVEDRKAVVLIVGDDQAALANGEPTWVSERPRVDQHGRVLPGRVDPLHAIVARVAYVQVALVVGDGAARGLVVAAASAKAELADSRPAAADVADHLSGRRLEQHYAVGAAVGECQEVAGGHRDRGNRGELPGLGARGAELPHELTLRVEHLDEVRALVTHVHRAVRPHGHSLREAQRAVATLSDLAGAAVRAGLTEAGVGVGRGRREQQAAGARDGRQQASHHWF